MAGVLSERQETGVVDAINSYYSKFGKPISVTAGSISLRNVVSAEKYGGRSSAGTEPYTDVIIRTKNKAYNISNKGTSAPSIAGGGLKGLELIIPGFSGRFLNAALKKYLLASNNTSILPQSNHFFTGDALILKSRVSAYFSTT